MCYRASRAFYNSFGFIHHLSGHIQPVAASIYFSTIDNDSHTGCFIEGSNGQIWKAFVGIKSIKIALS